MTNVATSPEPVSLSSLFDRVEALFKQAEIALSKERYELADYFFQSAHMKDPENLNLVFDEACIWHRYATLLESSKAFAKGYSRYRSCFYNSHLAVKAYAQAITLKFDEYKATSNPGALITAEKLINRLKRQNIENQNLNYLFALCLFYKGSHYQDLLILNQALNLFLKLSETDNESGSDNIIASIYLKLKDLTQDINYLLKAIDHRKAAISKDSNNIDLLSYLAKDYKDLYFETLDESRIDDFNETCELASFLKPENTKLYLTWAEGLIEMGSYAQNTDWVKLGIEKSHEASTRTASAFEIDLLLAQGFCYLGKKLDRLSHIQEAYEKIKPYEDDLSNDRMLSCYVDILIAFGSYFQDVDYYYQAIEKLQESLSIDNSKRHFWVKMAQIYHDISALDQNIQTCELALYMVEKALKFYRTSETLLLKASILLRLGEYKQSIEHYEDSLYHFELGFSFQPKLFQPRLSHIFEHAKTLDVCANFQEEDTLYMKALDQLTHIILIDPQYPDLHHQIALVQFHLGELTLNPELIKKSLIHFKLASKSSTNDSLYVDWAIACLTLSEMVDTTHEAIFLQHEAANKLKKALKQGQLQAYYFMACLCCVCNETEKALNFLKAAERHDALPPPEDMQQDEWLLPIQHEAEFIKILERQEVKRA